MFSFFILLMKYLSGAELLLSVVQMFEGIYSKTI